MTQKKKNLWKNLESYCVENKSKDIQQKYVINIASFICLTKYLNIFKMYFD